MFQRDVNSAWHNWHLMKNSNFGKDLTMPKSILDRTFKFNNLTYLGHILDENPAWPKLRSMLSKGIVCASSLMSESDRLERLEFNLKRGNHPTHRKISEEKLNEFIDDELSKGFIIPIPIEKVSSIPHAEACLIHVVKQNTIDEDGNEKKIKHRPIHDLSCSPKHLTNLPINSRHLEEEMAAIQYAFALWRIFHFVTVLHIINPFTPILFQKFDVDGAFKRLILGLVAAVKILVCWRSRWQTS